MTDPTPQPDPSAKPRRRLVLATVLIVTIVGLQTAATVRAVVQKLRSEPVYKPQTWPFMDYPMFSEASGPPVTTDMFWLTVQMPDGRWLEADQFYLEMGRFEWRDHLVQRLIAEPLDPADDPDLARLVERHRREAEQRLIEEVTQREGERPRLIHVYREHYEIRDGRLDRDPTTWALPVLPPPPDPAPAEPDEPNGQEPDDE